MMWPGKVNQHMAIPSGAWESDPDGKSGAEIAPLAYCKKFYPDTTTTRPGPETTITSWRAHGNQGAFTGTHPTIECVRCRALDATSPVRSLHTTRNARSGTRFFRSRCDASLSLARQGLLAPDARGRA